MRYFILYYAIHRRTLSSLPPETFPPSRATPQGLKLAYLDGPGGSQVPQIVIDTLGDFYATCNVNTHGNFWPSQEVDRRMTAAREVLAAFLGAESAGCISFGQNMTTLNYALSAAIGHTLKAGDEVLITQLDHEANRGPWLRLKERGMILQEVRLLPTGQLDLSDMAAKITPRTKVFAVGASSNALGTVNDLRLARRLTHEVGALLVVDAVPLCAAFSVGREEPRGGFSVVLGLQILRAAHRRAVLPPGSGSIVCRRIA